METQDPDVGPCPEDLPDVPRPVRPGTRRRWSPVGAESLRWTPRGNRFAPTCVPYPTGRFRVHLDHYVTGGTQAFGTPVGSLVGRSGLRWEGPETLCQGHTHRHVRAKTCPAPPVSFTDESGDPPTWSSRDPLDPRGTVPTRTSGSETAGALRTDDPGCRGSRGTTGTTGLDRRRVVCDRHSRWTKVKLGSSVTEVVSERQPSDETRGDPLSSSTHRG